MIDFPPCVPEWDTLSHKHSRRCVVRVMRELPTAPHGWRWVFGHHGKQWALWLERVGGGPARWHVVGLPVASSASGLVAVIWSYCQGNRHIEHQRE